MDMSFHLQQLGKASRLGGPNADVPAHKASARGRMVTGDGPMRALSHIELMALVSNRTNRNRMRHWQSEAMLLQKSGDDMAARVALFAGAQARHPAWARSAAGPFARNVLNGVAPTSANKSPNQNHEDDVYLGALSNRKVLPVNNDIQDANTANGLIAAHPCDVEI